MAPKIHVLRALSLAAATWVLSSSAGAAPPLERSRLLSVWKIVPSEDAPSKASIKRDQPGLILGRLLPTALAITSGDLRDDATGLTLLPSGVQVVRMTSAGPPVFCTTQWGKNYKKTYIMDSYGDALCLIDDDENGEFDRYFKKLSRPYQLLAFVGRCTPTKGALTKGVKYSSVDPADFLDHMNVALTWGKGQPGAINISFEVVNIKGGGAKFGYIRGFKTDRTPYNLFDGTVSFSREDGIVHMELLRPIVPQSINLIPDAMIFFSNNC